MDFITLNKIKKVREITGIGILNCRKALEKVGGNVDEAVRELYTSNINNKCSSSNNSSELKHGHIHIAISENRDVISMVEVGCKTDFVSFNTEFRQYVMDLALCVMENRILDKEYLSNKTDAKIIELASDRLFFLSKKFGENLVIKNVFYSGNLDGFYGFYVHTVSNISRIGVVVITDIRNDIVSNTIAMQIAALNPINLQSLFEQEFMLDDKISVELYLKRNNVNIKKYVRFALGI